MSFSKKEKYLMEHDLLLKKIIINNGRLKNTPKTDNIYHSLVNIVISQFISTSAASAISNRILEEFKKNVFTPKLFLNLTVLQIKELGLSTNKAKSILEISQIFSPKNIELKVKSFNEDELEEFILGIYGLGPWSLHMLKLFSLGYEDVFSSGDAALRKAMENASMVKAGSNTSEYDKYAKKWSPYRSIASRHLWTSLA